jgi:hypothetical protein
MKFALVSLLPVLIAQSADKPVPNNDDNKQPFALKLDQEAYATDTSGVANPNVIINLKPGLSIRIYLPGGKCFTALVKETTMLSGGVFKVFGEMTNSNNTGFGFVLTKDGIFAGAIVQRDTNTTHTLSYDEAAKGYVFKYAVEHKIGS